VKHGDSLIKLQLVLKLSSLCVEVSKRWFHFGELFGKQKVHPL
jgi:hypothetical protein